ncbi:MAG: hypothetical protein ACYDH8_09260 [Syntrophales bacterium]
METGHKQYNYNEIVCQIVLPYCVRVPEEEYQFNNKDVNVSLTFRRHERISKDDHFELSRKDGQRDIIQKERFGRYDYSTVDIVLKKTFFHYDPSLEFNAIKELALNCVRKFIQFYKLAYDEYWIIDLSVNDILTFHAKFYNDGVNIPGATFVFLGSPDINCCLSWQDYLDNKKYNRQEMLNRLKTNHEMPLYIQLMMEGTRLCHAASYDIGVILFDRSFESFFDTVVKAYLHKNNLFAKEWDSYLEMEFVGRNPRKSKLKTYSSRVSKSGTEFNDQCDLYTEWLAKCRHLRNDIIHGKRSGIGEEEAYQARESARSAFTFFGFSWFDFILIRDQYFDQSQNLYDIPIPSWLTKR